MRFRRRPGLHGGLVLLCSSLPLGGGWVEGFTPFIATSVVAATGSTCSGLIYPIAVGRDVGSFLIKKTRRVSMWEEVEGFEPAHGR